MRRLFLNFSDKFIALHYEITSNGWNDRDDERRKLLKKVADLNYFNPKAIGRTTSDVRQKVSELRVRCIDKYIIDRRRCLNFRRRCVASSRRVLQTRGWRPWSVAHAQGKPKITGIEPPAQAKYRDGDAEKRRRKVRPDGKPVDERERRWKSGFTMLGEGMPSDRRFSQTTKENARSSYCLRTMEKFEKRRRIFAQLATSRESRLFFSFSKCHRARTTHLSTYGLSRRCVGNYELRRSMTQL